MKQFILNVQLFVGHYTSLIASPHNLRVQNIVRCGPSPARPGRDSYGLRSQVRNLMRTAGTERNQMIELVRRSPRVKEGLSLFRRSGGQVASEGGSED